VSWPPREHLCHVSLVSQVFPDNGSWKALTSQERGLFRLFRWPWDSRYTFNSVLKSIFFDSFLGLLPGAGGVGAFEEGY
jgi:hypothetical protein